MRKEAIRQKIKEYLKSRRNAILRTVIFALLAVLFYRIGKIWKESFYVTLRFFYPISVIAALFQIFYFLPKWKFIKPGLKKTLKKLAGPVFHTLKAAFRRMGEGFVRFQRRFRRDKTNATKKKGKKTDGAFRDEFFYAEGQGLFGHRRRRLKWRDMKTNGDKVRFYYMRYVFNAVKKGAPFGYHLTPEELKVLWKSPEGAEPLTGLYYRARYSQQEIGEAELEGLQEEGSR